MRVIGVIDIRRGRAVHARAGDRATYQPVASVGSLPLEPGNARALAESYVERLGVTELYVADLDAILQDEPGAQTGSASQISAVASLGVPLWLDSGISSISDAQR